MQKNRGVGHGETLTKKILLNLAKLGVFAVASTSPYFLGQIAKEYFKDLDRKNKQSVTKEIRRLQKRKLVILKESANGNVRVELTHEGVAVVKEYNLQNLKIDKPVIWDKKWRLLIYDIPEKNKKAREAFRVKIKQLGLFPLQKSVWISAYDCLAEIELLCELFDIDGDNHIIYLTIGEVPRSAEIKKWFSLS